LNNFDTFIEFCTVENTWSAQLTFLHRFVTNLFR